MTPFVHVYDNLIESLEASGYKQGENLFVWNYDWRRPVDEIDNNFKNFIDSSVKPKIGSQKYIIAGHSLGGLVGRSYVQKYNDADVEKLITIGSPHAGATRAYLAWAGGELWDKTSWAGLALEMYIYLNKPLYGSRLNVIRSLAPVLKDLIPTYSFLLDDSRRPINSAVKNDWLTYLNQTFGINNLTAVYGRTNTKPTLYQLVVSDRSFWDKLNNYWPDGRVVDKINSYDGDGTVLVKSAQLGNNTLEVKDRDHLGIISSDDGVRVVLNQIGVPAGKVVSKPTIKTRTNALIFFAHSPVEIQVIDSFGNKYGYQGANDSVFYSPDDKLLVIPSINKSSNYTVKLIGTGSGEYVLDVGASLADGRVLWQTNQGQIKSGQTITYGVTYDPDSSKLILKSPNKTEADIQTLINQISRSNAVRKRRRLRYYLRQSKRFLRLAEKYQASPRRRIYLSRSKRFLTLFEVAMIKNYKKIPPRDLLWIKDRLDRIDNLMLAMNNKTPFYSTGRNRWVKRLNQRNKYLLSRIKQKLTPQTAFFISFETEAIENQLNQLSDKAPDYVYKQVYFYQLLRSLIRQV
ncbi:MAG: hypothetical protein GXP43_01750 [bacterium]|nr:hypothetical protein [bacterium]